MEPLVLFGVVLAVVLFAAAWQARRIGNERRDVTLLGVSGGVSAAGAALTFLL